MSKTGKKKRRSAYSLDSQTFRLLGGLILIAFGTLIFLSVVIQLSGMMFEAFRTVSGGLCGILCFLLPVFPIWGGVLLMMSGKKQPDWKTFVLAAVVYMLLMTMFNLFSYTSGGGQSRLPLMNYFYQHSIDGSFPSMLGEAYTFSGTSFTPRAGGLLGMLIAWPLWRLMGPVFSGILCLIATLAILPFLLHLNLPQLRDRAAGKLASLRAQRDSRMQAQNQQELQWQQSQVQKAQYYQAQAAAQAATGGQPAAAVSPQPAGQNRVPNPKSILRRGKSVAGIPETPEEHVAPLVQHSAPLQFSKIFGRQTDAGKSTPSGQDTAWQNASDSAQWSTEGMHTFVGPDGRLYQAVPVESQAAAPAEPAPAASTAYQRPEVPSVSENSMPDDPVFTPEPAVPFSPAAESMTDEKPEQKPAKTQRGQRRPSSWASQVEQKIQEHTEPEEEPVFPDDDGGLLKPLDSWSGQQKPDDASGRRHSDEVQLPPDTGRSLWQPDLEIRDPGKNALFGDGQESAAPVVQEPPYIFPSIDFLKGPSPMSGISPEEDAVRARRLEETLASFRINAQVRNITHGPAISRFELELAAGIKVSKITDLGPNIAMNMEVKSVRIEAPIPGKSLVGVEVPNKKVATVTLREVLESEKMRSSKDLLMVALGRDIAGTPVTCNLAKMPHLLIAGATGSGKSVCINAIINSLLYRCTPEEVRLIMVDPKVVELQCYNGIPHLLAPVVSDPHKASGALQWAVDEMMHRYEVFTQAKVRNIEGYNESLAEGEKKMPRIVIIIDELADLMLTCKREVEEYICRIAQLARAAGIHLIVATQRPSVDVITGLIKANIPSRIAFKVSSFIDSRTILDKNGAEQLLGWGDMLYQPMGEFTPMRVQGCFLSDDEVNRITSFIRQNSEPDYDEKVVETLNKIEQDAGAPPPDMADTLMNENGDTDLLNQCIEMAIADGQVSTSLIQRRLKIGYARAGRLVDEMEKRGIVSAKDGAKPRICLITREDYEKLKDSGSLIA